MAGADSAAAGRERAGADDPFAVDLFARERKDAPAQASFAPSRAELELASGVEGDASWAARLPRVSRAQLLLSGALGASLPNLSGRARAALARALSQYLRVPEGEVSISNADMRETEFPSDAVRVENAKRVWATFALAPGGERFGAALGTDFAAALVDRMLGGEGRPPETLRPLSRTELAAIEFLWLCLIRELHLEAAAPLWQLEGVSDKTLAWPAGDGEAATAHETRSRVIAATLGVRVGALKGLVSFYFDRVSLAAFVNLSRSPLLADGGDELLKLYERVAPVVGLRPVIGETEVAAVDLAELEAGDVVVIARPWARLEAGVLRGRVEMRVGAGAGAILSGTLASLDAVAGANGRAAAAPAGGDGAETQLLIEQIRRAAEIEGTERWNMEQERATEDADAGAIALEEILLTVHVELAQRRLSLEELARLRVGQLLPLGCRPTDPVDLVADGRRIARGELVDIEGQLGVRITQVTGG